jgi:hypothetical protein
VIARTLSRRIELLTCDTEVFRALQFLECDPEIVGKTVNDLAISVESFRGHFRILARGEILSEEMTPRAIMEALHAHLFALSLGEYPMSPLLHAASLRRDGRRVLFVGGKGVGKTTLALRLIREGYEFECDENVFVTSTGVVARPRALRVKESAIQIVPEIAQTLMSAPSYRDHLGQVIYNLDPRLVGARSWRIESGDVDAIVVLRCNHGGNSSWEPIPPLAVFRDVIQESGFRESDRGEAVNLLTRVIGGTSGFTLSVGDSDRAVHCINELFQRLK